MDTTPSKSPRMRPPQRSSDLVDSGNKTGSSKIKKPPPITPRRFTRFFTPRVGNSANVARSSRAALRAISNSALNTRSAQSAQPKSSLATDLATTPRGKKRKLSFVPAEDVPPSSPVSKPSLRSDAQDLIRSSPTIPERRTPTHRFIDQIDFCDTEDETDIEDEEFEEHADPPATPRIIPYRSKTTSGSILSSRLTGRRAKREIHHSANWQREAADFYSDAIDINSDSVVTMPALPFSAAPCNTNPLVAIGDEEGRIRLLDTSDKSETRMTKTWISMQPHENAVMDLDFSPDDKYLATASGDQTCQIIDMATQTSLYTLRDHRSSVKQVSFQPGSNQVLASSGRDGRLNFWDLRCNNIPANHPNLQRGQVTPGMVRNSSSIAPTHKIGDAHHAGTKPLVKDPRQKPNLVPGRMDFSVTSLSFLGTSKPHLLVTASELDSTIKVWDIRTGFGTSRLRPKPLSLAPAPGCHARHRPFGVTSLVVSTDGSRLYSLSRDHTVYVYSTSHLILGASNQLSTKSKASRIRDNNEGLGPLYGFRHPQLRIETFWPRLAIRERTESQTELLAVGSSEDCAVLFPTDERYLTSSSKQIPSNHIPTQAESKIIAPAIESTQDNLTSRPTLLRSSSSSTSFTTRHNSSFNDSDTDTNPLPIYYHGTPLIRGHDKEVTSLAWSSEGHLITTSDDYIVRCWRENSHQARRMRLGGEQNGNRARKGWSHVGIPDYDNDY